VEGLNAPLWLALAAVLGLGVACDDAAPAGPAPTEAATAPTSSPAETPAPTPTPPAPSPSPSLTPLAPLAEPEFETFALPDGSHPHDVAPAPDGTVWYTAQRGGALGRLDPATGEVEEAALGAGSAPHGVIVGPDGAPWVTDSGRNAIIRVDPASLAVEEFGLPGGNANLNTAAFDGDGSLWFTGQAGVYGSVDPATGEVAVHDAPRGRGPYGIDATPDGTVWYSSLAGSYIARIEGADGALTTFDVPTEGGGARRIWSDSTGGLWVTEWFAGRLARFDPATETWDEWDLPARGARPYAVFVDDRDNVWVTDFATNALVALDPATETFRSFPFPQPGAEVRQLLGRPGEVWGVGSATDSAIVLRTGR